MTRSLTWPGTVEDALAARHTACEAERTAEEATVAAARELLAEGYTIRDAGRMLGL